MTVFAGLTLIDFLRGYCRIVARSPQAIARLQARERRAAPLLARDSQEPKETPSAVARGGETS